MYVQVATEAGSSSAPNEDRAVAQGPILVIADGLTARTQTGCIHGTPWFVEHLSSFVSQSASGRDLREGLRLAIERTAALHRTTCDLDNPATPCAAVGIVNLSNQALDYLVLGDVTLVARVNGGIHVVSDSRISQTALSQRAFADTLHASSPSKPAALRRMKDAELLSRNQPGGYWVAAAMSAAADHAVTGTLSVSSEFQCALMTDGAARAVDLFALFGWSEALDCLGEVGPGGLIRLVRATEAKDAEATKWPRNKVSDDATVVYVEGPDVAGRRTV